MKYKELKTGDIRQLGDQINRQHRYGWPENWYPVKLIGYPILESDLMVDRFRRPMP